MGSQSIVCGYLETEPAFDYQNETVLRMFPFDPKYPFPNVFSNIRPGYQSSMISFASSFKSLLEDWDEWENKFELLLAQLYARAEKVRLDEEVEGAAMTIVYVCVSVEGSKLPPAARKWRKWYYARDGTVTGEHDVAVPP